MTPRIVGLGLAALVAVNLVARWRVPLLQPSLWIVSFYGLLVALAFVSLVDMAHGFRWPGLAILGGIVVAVLLAEGLPRALADGPPIWDEVPWPVVLHTEALDTVPEPQLGCVRELLRTITGEYWKVEVLLALRAVEAVEVERIEAPAWCPFRVRVRLRTLFGLPYDESIWLARPTRSIDPRSNG